MTHLNDISNVYMEKVAKPDFLDLDKDGNKKEPMKKAAVEAPKERLKTDRDGYRVPKKDADAARERLLAKARAKRAKMSEALDPVGQEDSDVNNDKKVDKTDKYLLKRRKAIAKAMKEGKSTDIEVPSKDLKGAVKKAVKRIDTNVSGDVNKKDKSMGEFGEFVPSPDGKKKVTTKMEGYSDWRDDLREVMGDSSEEQKQVKEKKVKNNITVNPKISEEVTILENVEIDEWDTAIYIVYDELIEEGYSEDQVEEAIEISLNEVSDSYYDSAVASSKEAGSKVKVTKVKTPQRSMKDRLKSAAKKAIVGASKAAGKAMKAKAAVQAAPGKAKVRVKSVTDRVKSAAKSGYESGRGPVEKKPTTYRGAGVGRKEKIGEEKQMSPQEINLQKRKIQIDKMISAKRRQQLDKIKKEPVRAMGEGKGDPCWDSHKQVGMKKKGNRMVPNCVPKEEVSIEEDRAADAKASLDKVKARQKVLDKYEKKTGKKLDINKSVEARDHKKNFPGAKRTAKKVKGAKETPAQTQDRRIRQASTRIATKGYTSKEKKEVDSMAKHASRFD